MDTLITNHKDMMSFFQEWELQMICDFYKAERDELGKEYCRNNDERFDYTKGHKILKDTILEYPKAFANLMSKCSWNTSKEHLQLENIDNMSAQQKIDFADNLAGHLLSHYCDENLKTISKAIAEGFLLEWIAFHIPEKKNFIEHLTKLLQYHKDDPKFDFDQWLYDFFNPNNTRQEIISRCDNFRNYVNCYFYHRIYLGNCLDVIFRALNVSHHLALADRDDYLFGAIKKHGIGSDVQKFYDFRCIKRKYYNKKIRFTEDIGEVSVSQVSVLEVSVRLDEIFESIDAQDLTIKKTDLLSDLKKLLEEKSDFFDAIITTKERRGRNSNEETYEISIRKIIGMFVYLFSNNVDYVKFARCILNSMKDKTENSMEDIQKATKRISKNLEAGNKLYGKYVVNKEDIPSNPDRTICSFIDPLVKKYKESKKEGLMKD